MLLGAPEDVLKNGNSLKHRLSNFAKEFDLEVANNYCEIASKQHWLLKAGLTG